MPAKPTTDPSTEGFIHKGRIVYGLMYHYVGGTSQIVWLDRDGNGIDRGQGTVRLADNSRRIVTAKPGDWVCWGDERRQIATVEVYRSLPLVPVVPPKPKPKPSKPGALVIF